MLSFLKDEYEDQPNFEDLQKLVEDNPFYNHHQVKKNSTKTQIESEEHLKEIKESINNPSQFELISNRYLATYTPKNDSDFAFKPAIIQRNSSFRKLLGTSRDGLSTK